MPSTASILSLILNANQIYFLICRHRQTLGSLSACSVSASHLGLCVLPEPQHWGLLEFMGSTPGEPRGGISSHRTQTQLCAGTGCIPPELLAHKAGKSAFWWLLTRFEKNNYNTGYNPQISGEENLGQIQRWPCEWQMWCIVLLQLVHNMAQPGKQETEI